jgi:hypothetical protein
METIEARTPNVSVSLKTRSAISNGKRMLPGVDGRSPAARRYRDLVADFTRDLGGAALSAAEVALIRQAAALMVRAEALQAAIIRGETVDDETAVRLTNAATRVLTAISGRKRKREPASQTLDEYVAARKAARAAEAEATRVAAALPGETVPSAGERTGDAP